jgi:hypothetical protein
MPSDPPRWYDPSADNPRWIKALAEVRMLACREGWCYPHVQAIIVSIDQYAESALGNRGYFRGTMTSPDVMAYSDAETPTLKACARANRAAASVGCLSPARASPPVSLV